MLLQKKIQSLCLSLAALCLKEPRIYLPGNPVLKYIPPYSHSFHQSLTAVFLTFALFYAEHSNAER